MIPETLGSFKTTTQYHYSCFVVAIIYEKSSNLVSTYLPFWWIPFNVSIRSAVNGTDDTSIAVHIVKDAKREVQLKTIVAKLID